MNHHQIPNIETNTIDLHRGLRIKGIQRRFPVARRELLSRKFYI